jgi:hypothetical protein
MVEVGSRSNRDVVVPRLSEANLTAHVAMIVN